MACSADCARGALYGAIQQIKDTTAEDPFLFLRLFTTSRDPLPSFVSFLSFLVPLMAIGLGFDSINGEYNRRTLSRILAQPIYRDALLFGKFLAGLATLSISMVTLWLLVIGLGLLLIGIPPGAEEIARSFVFLLVTIVYAGVWLALAMLFSSLFRSAATAALVTLGIWLLLTFIWPVLAGAVAQIIVPPDPRYMALGLQTPGTAELEQILARFSPSTLFAEVVVALLDPTTRALGPIYLSQLQGAVLGAPLPLASSVLIAWPQIVAMVATARCFVRRRLRGFPAPGSPRLGGLTGRCAETRGVVESLPTGRDSWPLSRQTPMTASREFRANQAAMRELVAELEAQRAKAAEGGPPHARERHIARGKLLPRDRVLTLIDPGTPFLELSPLAANGMYDDAIHAAGIITGIGRVSGRECVIVCNNSTIKGGTYYPMTVKKHLRAQEDRAREPFAMHLSRRLPAAPTCRIRPMFFQTASISAASSTIRRRCRPPAFRRSPWSWARARLAALTCRRCRTRPSSCAIRAPFFSAVRRW